MTTDPTAIVAGRPAYQLVLEPKDTSTLVGTVKIAIDGATHIPTRVQVFPRGSSTPAFEVGFTSFNPSTPSDSVFAFNPPPGATVTEGLGEHWQAQTRHGLGHRRGHCTGRRRARRGRAKPTVVGDGWTSVVVATLPSDQQSGDGLARLSNALGSFDERGQAACPRSPGAWGSGHVLRGKLFSVLVTDDGRVVAGSVAPEALYAALSAS